MTQPPELRTARLRLVPPDPDRAAEVFEYGRNLAFAQAIESPPMENVEEARRFLSALRDDNHAGRRLYWALVLVESGRAIGSMGFLFSHPAGSGVADFGYGIDPGFWGNGLFQEGASTVLRFGIQQLGLRRIQVMTRARNDRAIRAVEKLGFVREGVLRAYYALPSGPADCIVLGLLAADLAVDRPDLKTRPE